MIRKKPVRHDVAPEAPNGSDERSVRDEQASERSEKGVRKGKNRKTNCDRKGA